MFDFLEELKSEYSAENDLEEPTQSLSPFPETFVFQDKQIFKVASPKKKKSRGNKKDDFDYNQYI